MRTSPASAEIFEQIRHGLLDEKSPALVSWMREQLLAGRVPALGVGGGVDQVVRGALEAAIEKQSFCLRAGTQVVAKIFVVPIHIESIRTLSQSDLSITQLLPTLAKRMKSDGLIGARDNVVFMRNIVPGDDIHAFTHRQAYDLACSLAAVVGAGGAPSEQFENLTSLSAANSGIQIGGKIIYQGYLVGCAYGVRGRHQINLSGASPAAEAFRAFVNTHLEWQTRNSQNASLTVRVSLPRPFYSGVAEGFLEGVRMTLNAWSELLAETNVSGDGMIEVDHRHAEYPRLLFSFQSMVDEKRASFAQEFSPVTYNCMPTVIDFGKEILKGIGLELKQGYLLH